MGNPAFIDLATDLLPILESGFGRPFEEQIRAWQAYYRAWAPGLPRRLYKDYACIPGGWKGVARDRVWPRLPERMARMRIACRSIRGVWRELARRSGVRLGMRGPLVFVAYVGIGNGAGWATRWEGRPAVLLGLENIAELNWHRRPEIRKIMAHEIGHLFIFQVSGERNGLGFHPLLDLFEEGFAQHAEHVVLGRRTWGCSSRKGWLTWCLSHERYLARRYLREMNDTQKRRRFFGSWFDVAGWRQTGYFLGCRIVERLAEKHGLGGVAGWPRARIRKEVLTALRDLAAGHGNGQRA